MPEPQPVESETERLKLSTTPPRARSAFVSLGAVVNQIVGRLSGHRPSEAQESSSSSIAANCGSKSSHCGSTDWSRDR
mgnify:CR=1 FL=1